MSVSRMNSSKSTNHSAGPMPGNFSSAEIRQFTSAQPAAISKAEFFLADHSDDKVLKRALGYFDPKLPPEQAPQGSREAAGDNSLVQRRKSPTAEDLAAQRAKTATSTRRNRLTKWSNLMSRLHRNLNGTTKPLEVVEPLTFKPIQLDWQKNPVKCLQAHGFVVNAPVMARLQHRDWSNEWRIRVQAQARTSDAPPPQAGDRFTEQLTERAVRKVFESGAYVQVLRGGYTTFTTLTFDDEQRERVLTSKPQTKNRTKPGVPGTIVVMSPHGRDPYRLKADGHFTWLDDMGKAGELAAINMGAIKSTGKTDFTGQEVFELGSPSIRAEGPWTKIRAYQPDSSIGNEVSRFIDLAQKTYQRGWKPDFMPARVKRGQSVVREAGEKCGKVIADGPFTPIRRGDSKDKIEQNPRWKEGRDGKLKKCAVPLDYCWVAEMPANENGEPNPHVHLLMRWKVPATHFHAWAARLERIWGNGFAKLERIKYAKAGAGYLVKAVGYAAKGRDGNQGMIRGNRYAIGASARAVDWKDVASFQADNMAAIIAECEEKLARKNAHYEEQERRARIKLKETKRIHQITRNNKKLTEEQRLARIEKYKNKMQALDSEIEQAREVRRQRGVRAVGHYQITFSGENSTENFDNFLGWALNCRQWQANSRNEAIKGELESAKMQLVSQLREEHKALQDDLDLSDEQISRLEYVHNRLDEVQADIDYHRMLRLQMANTLQQQRSYWRNYESCLSQQRTSLDYWSSFINRYEIDEEQEDRDHLLTMSHLEDMGCRTKETAKPALKSGLPTKTTQLAH